LCEVRIVKLPVLFKVHIPADTNIALPTCSHSLLNLRTLLVNCLKQYIYPWKNHNNFYRHLSFPILKLTLNSSSQYHYLSLGSQTFVWYLLEGVLCCSFKTMCCKVSGSFEQNLLYRWPLLLNSYSSFLLIRELLFLLK